MEEDLNEDELEERLYAMIHYVDQTQPPEDNNVEKNDSLLNLTEATPASTLKRYWRTKPALCNKPFQKVNQPSVNTTKSPLNSVNSTDNSPNINKPKEEKNVEQKTDTNGTFDMSIFQSPLPEDTKTTVQILDDDDNPRVVELETSDEDEVVEIAIPPKPTITIESSDDEEIIQVTPKGDDIKKVDSSTSDNLSPNKESINVSRDASSASPVPSVVSSVSDDFIRGDCIALNISSRKPDNHTFDFSLHGSDLLDQNTSSRKKKKKNKDANSLTTPVQEATSDKPVTVNQKNADECFATPKSKQKKKQKTKTKLSQTIIANADIYDSDSNHSMSDLKKKQTYFVDEKSCPNADIYESDSSQSEIAREMPTPSKAANLVINPVAVKSLETAISKKTKTQNKSKEAEEVLQKISEVIDLTADSQIVDTSIEESIVFGNVTGLEESEDNSDNDTAEIASSKVGSTKIPTILLENLDFDYLKGRNSPALKNRYSLKTLRAEMDKFYNESWGGENFNHKEIQKTMSRDRSLWEIDPKDRMPMMSRRKVMCGYCNRQGHKEDTCRMKPPVCHMCGSAGHYETRCPNKICVNCGSPNEMFSTVCRRCTGWSRVTCPECGQLGHPDTHCPDLWRRYHNTIDVNTPLEQPVGAKKYNQLFCSGCTRRGHLVHTCRVGLPFSGLPINTPFVVRYQPVYSTAPQQPTRHNSANDSQVTSCTNTPKPSDNNKRMSKSPTCHSTHNPKRRTLEENAPDNRRNSYRSNHSESNAEDEERNHARTPRSNTPKSKFDKTPTQKEKNTNLYSSNRDKNGKEIQDNEVSDTSVAMTTSRIYVTGDVIEKINTSEGKAWLNEKKLEHNVDIEDSDVNSFLSIKGTLAGQEAFQSDLRDWMNSRNGQKHKRTVSETSQDDSNQNPAKNIPKNRDIVLRQLEKAFESLKEYMGEPSALFKELCYLQNHRKELMKQKIVSPRKLSNNKDYIKDILKRLNVVLLGQAGLAGGSNHLRELQTIQEKLSTYRQMEIPIELRKQIGEHYKSIFVGVPRDDYAELIQTYNRQNQRRQAKGLKRRADSGDGIDVQERAPRPPQVMSYKVAEAGPRPVRVGRGGRRAERALSGGTACYRRLVSARVRGPAARRRQLLARRLRASLAAAAADTTASTAATAATAKLVRKLQKITEQVKLFISSIK